LTKDEMAALAPEKTRAIEVQDFVDLEEIDPIYFDSPYYLGPADGAEKAYALLAKAMQASGKVAICHFVLRNKEHLAAIRSDGKVLTLPTRSSPPRSWKSSPTKRRNRPNASRRWPSS
jgi:DNA end-binding protein Ku